MQRRHHQGEEETKARAKTGIPLPPDGFSSAHLFLEPLFPTVFYPPTFCLPPETEPHSSICTFFYSYVFRLGLHSVLLFEALWLFSKQIYKNVFFLKLLFLQIRCQASAVCFVNHCIGRPDGSALSGLPKPFTLVIICADFFICDHRQKGCCDMQQPLLYQSI